MSHPDVPMNAGEVLRRVEAGELSAAAALPMLREGFTEHLGHTRIDHDRADRVGAPEVIFGLGKTPAQVVEIAERMAARGSDVLVTRASHEMIEAVTSAVDGFEVCVEARALWLKHERGDARAGAREAAAPVPVVCAGTSDVPVAEEARVTLEFYGQAVTPIYDCGVAGLHRLLGHLPALRAARVVVVVAGMEGALPSVVAGQVACPVIAVPTSVGYGASLGGVAALLAMLNSCASGVVTVNIDNGFGAGYTAAQITRIGTGPSPEADAGAGLGGGLE